MAKCLRRSERYRALHGRLPPRVLRSRFLAAELVMLAACGDLLRGKGSGWCTRSPCGTAAQGVMGVDASRL